MNNRVKTIRTSARAVQHTGLYSYGCIYRVTHTHTHTHGLVSIIIYYRRHWLTNTHTKYNNGARIYSHARFLFIYFSLLTALNASTSAGARDPYTRGYTSGHRGRRQELCVYVYISVESHWRNNHRVSVCVLYIIYIYIYTCVWVCICVGKRKRTHTHLRARIHNGSVLINNGITESPRGPPKSHFPQEPPRQRMNSGTAPGPEQH